jgi:hypothetical protein
MVGGRGFGEGWGPVGFGLLRVVLGDSGGEDGMRGEGRC